MIKSRFNLSGLFCQINLNKVSLIIFNSFLLGLGKEMKRQVNFGIIIVLRTVILPRAVNFLMDHNLIYFFISSNLIS